MARHLTDLHALNSQQRAKFFQLVRNVPDSNCAVMRRPMDIPLVHKAPRPERKSVTGIGVANFENWTGHGFAFRHQQLKSTVHRLDHGKQSHRTMFDRHFHGEPGTYLAVIDVQRAHFDLSLGNRDMPWTVMAHEYDIVVIVCLLYTSRCV